MLRWQKLDLVAVAGDLDGGIHRSIDNVGILGDANHNLGRVFRRDRLKIDDEEVIKREDPSLGQIVVCLYAPLTAALFVCKIVSPFEDENHGITTLPAVKTAILLFVCSLLWLVFTDRE